MHLETSRPIALLAALVLITGCGGGGDETADSDKPSGPSTPPSGRVLGERDVPGYGVRVTGVTEAADSIAVRVKVTPEDSRPLPNAVMLWSAKDYRSGATGISAVPVTGSNGVYEATVTKPNPLPKGTAVWVRLTMPDGSVLEAGRDAFPLR